MSMDTMAARIQYLGGDKIGRMNKQKLRSFKSALKNDYNKRMIKTSNEMAWPCLINSNSLKPDYDKKILSIEFDSQVEVGDVIEVVNDNTHWMVYLQDLMETAYLKSEIIRCRYSIDINDEKYWVYFKGPTEMDIDWSNEDDIYFNELNLSGMIYIKNNAATKEFFQRFTKIEIEGQTWQVAAVDSISVPGILEVAIKEYFNNEIEKLPSITKENDIDKIIGETTVYQNSVVGYTVLDADYNESSSWKITGNDRVEIAEIIDDKICKVKINAGAIKTFVISYGSYSKTITIDTTTCVIKGDTVVYPYETKTYKVVYDETYDSQGNPVVTPVGTCAFSISNDLAEIVSTTSTTCTIEIVSGKSGNFVLTAKADGKTYTLPIKIKSL